MAAVARVVVDLSLDRWFDYSVPPELREHIRPGSGVRVPFGRRMAEGYVIELTDRSEFATLKPIAELIDDVPMLSESLLALARWMASYYLAPLESAVRTVLPAAVRSDRVGFKEAQVLEAVPDAATPEELDALGRRAPQQARAFAFLREHGPATATETTRGTGVGAGALQALRKRGWLRAHARTERRGPLLNRNILPTEPLPLMEQQAEALAAVLSAVDEEQPPVVLLYGVTGSGKTEVYLQAISNVLHRDPPLGAIVLVPEISLTPQTVERFVGRFGERVAVLHSRLSDGERHDEWHRIRAGQADIVVGARSAVFAPLRRLGLIVVDEEHEPSYKQEEAPRYNARDVAVMRGRLEKCVVVLGSATPAIESWSNAKRGKYRLVRMPHRVDHRTMPHMRVIDMRADAEAAGQAGVFSADLLDAIRLRLDRAEQTILFLNRRGFSSSLICRACGYVAGCDHCSVACTYHRRDERLRCHICGAARKVPERCPACADPSFKYTGAGTQRVEDIVRRCFPHARIERMDADTTVRKDSYERVLGDFRAGKIDILIGTQMIAKGLHFPNVTLVGVIHADLSLHMPDFRAGERTFQLLAQVAGRAGRGDITGEVIVQTFTPFHPAIQAARRVDFETFADQEIEFRRQLTYPPFAHVVMATLRGATEENVAAFANSLHSRLKPAEAAGVILSDASPAPLARAKGLYRYQILLRCASVHRMAVAMRQALAAARPPDGVTLAVDVDAMSML